jgi:L-lactate dehydrogenase complex protein LldF
MEIRSQHFETLAEKALRDRRLQGALRNVGLGFQLKQEEGFARISDPEALRDRGHEVKRRSIENLPLLLETLEKRVQDLGGVVHWARTAREAREIVKDLVKKHGVKGIVKGKSMVTEEIGLNEDLIKQGVQVSETDLGEFIIQLAGEPPSHIIGPACHKTKEQIAELFAEKLGGPPAETPEELTMIARRKLRNRFIHADMGITGVNAAIAETGTIVLIENEGNIRMSTTLPRILVSVMGIEKVVPTLDDVVALLEVLPRSATGQELGTYVTMVTGPSKEGELEGPEEYHLIILDNGRTQILADPDLRETLYCVRCGSCQNVCPVYQKVGGHSYGWVYGGPIGSVLTPQLVPHRLAKALPFASTLCGACAEVCPVKIPLPKLLLTLRQRYVEDRNWDGGISLVKRMTMSAYGRIIAHPNLYKILKMAMRLAGPILAPSGRWTFLPPPLARWGRRRRVPVPAGTFSQKWPALRRQLRHRGNGS